MRRCRQAVIPQQLLPPRCGRHYDELVHLSRRACATPAAGRLHTRQHRRLFELTLREEKEEYLRDFLPEKPLLPHAWTVAHTPGSNRFDLHKTVEVRACGVEEMHVTALMERKAYEFTYRVDTGERREEAYLNFALFIHKPRYPRGGLEFGLTSIDLELVLDSLAIHGSDEAFRTAREAWGSSSLTNADTNTRTSSSSSSDATQMNVLGSRAKSCLSYRLARDRGYRGPMMNELDDDLSDEILDYLDERGVNNAFAEFMMKQAYYLEQENYLHWLRLLRRFAD